MLRRCIARRTIVKKRESLFQPSSSVHGFTVNGVRVVEELNLVAYEMTHHATKAKYYHIDSDDTNNTFCIGFRTPAENNKGTSHVLEHTVLCGSEKHPVRDPFFMMLRRSLSSFMNAMTGADYTLYPFSTTNTQDFQNLLGVYLDAVFFPLLREEDFKQEGHRVEAVKPESGASGTPDIHLEHNGVVFNEMRGVVTDPSNHFCRCVLRTMLPDTHYVFNSGGNPPDILTLTYEELVEFHRRHYSPSNSVTLTYGSQHPEAHLKALNEYFSRFPETAPVKVPTLPERCRFKAPIDVQLEGPLDVMGNPKMQKRIIVSYGIPQEHNDLQSVVAHSVLDDLLSVGPSSPMFKTLIESQIGSKYSPLKGYASYLSSPIMSYGVAGVDDERPNVEQEVLQAVTAALDTVRKDGFSARRVESVVFQQELSQRHRSSDFGLNLCTGLCGLCLCRSGTNPADYINWLPHLKRIEQENGLSLLSLVQKNLLENPHRAVISVSPKSTYVEEFRAHLKKLDDDLNSATPVEEKQRIEEQTAEWLERVRQPQNSDLLPTLKVSDIPKESFREPTPLPSSHSKAVSTIAYPTNGLVYVHGLVPHSSALIATMEKGSLADIPVHLPQWVHLVGQTGAGPFSFREHSVEAELVCGGFGFHPILNESYQSKGSFIGGVTFGFYTTTSKLQQALDLLRLTLLEPRTSEEDLDVYNRVLSHAKMQCSRSVQSLQSRGNAMAVSSAAARLSTRAAIAEKWSGLEKSREASVLLDKLQGSEEVCRPAVRELLQDYKTFAEEMVCNMKKGLMWATCEAEDQTAVDAALCRFQGAFPDSGPEMSGASCRLTLPSRTAAPVSDAGQASHPLPIDTSFVGLALPHDLTWAHPEHAALRVACQLLDNEYMHRKVREEGGAYGASVGPTLIGEVGGITMSSYRDPSPQKTVLAFYGAAEWLADAKHVTQEKIDEAKLRLFSKIDAPYTADAFGESYFLHDVPHELRQALRDTLLAVTPAQVVQAAKYLDTKHAAISVLHPESESMGTS